MKSLHLLSIGLLCCLLAPAQPLFTKPEQEVQYAIVKFFDALSSRDSLALKKYMTADIQLVEYGSLWNADTLIGKAIVQNTAPDFGRVNSFEFMRTKVDGSTAWVTYYLQSQITKNGQQLNLHWLETIVARKEAEHWKVAHLHSTLLKK